MRRARLGAPLVLLAWAAQAYAQETENVAPAEPGAEKPADGATIVVRALRGSAVTNIAPLATFDADTIEATGAATMAELLTAIRATTQSTDGSDPIFLLNGQRVSGYPEIGSLPPESIEKVEVLPEPAALRFGYPPTRRVVNFITKRRFRQIEARASAGTTTRWASSTEKLNFGLTRLRDDSRLTLGLEYRQTDPVLQAERAVTPDPEVPFDAIGNVTGIGGGEISPALSARAGQIVTIAPVPASPADRTLAGYAAGANQPRAFDLGPYRTLTPRNHAVKAEGVLGGPIGKSLAGSLTLSAEQSRNHVLWGPDGIRLIVPANNGFSPFGVPVVVNRYAVEGAMMDQHEKTTTLNLGATLRGAVSGWQWDLTGSLDRKQVDGLTDRGLDLTAANAAIAAGADPFSPLDPALLGAKLTDRTRQLTGTATAKAVVTGSPFHLPAGNATLTASVAADRSTASSVSRGANPSELDLARSRIEGSLAIDLPLASRREAFLPFLGELSVNGSVAAREVGGFGTLVDASYGATWSFIPGVELLASVKISEAAPDMALQSTPIARIANVPVFDYVAGRTEIVTLILGGNPDLLAEHRLVRSLGVTAKPFAKSELRLSATYEATRARNQVGTVYAITPLTSAILPDLFARDRNGRLVSVAYRPINFHLARQSLLRLTVSSSGKIGKAPPPPPPGTKGGPRQQISYYAGIGPTLKFSDRLQLRPGTPELDLLGGDTISGGGSPRAFGYAYGGINFYAFGLTFNAWYGGENRVRSADPVSDLHFSPIFKLNLGSYLSLGRVFKDKRWSRRLRLSLDISNATDARQRVRDRNGDLPYRYQPDLLDPVGRTVTFTLRKLF